MKQVVVVGGGAAGFFAAISCATKNPDFSVTILEKSSSLLSKVKISGGGRCNVTHACFDPKELVKNYPRGEKQLLGPFTRFHPAHTIEWFESKGVELKTEEDGRMFPITDSSQTIIDCFLEEAKRLGIRIRMQCGVDDIKPTEGKLGVLTNKGETLEADAVIVSTGSGASMWDILGKLGHTIVPPVPSLFTFNMKDDRISGLSGVSVASATVSVSNSKLTATGPLLITHWGMSGPGVLRLSAWGARLLAEMNHRFEITVNWTSKYTAADVGTMIHQYKKSHPKKSVMTNPLFGLPKRLWERLVSSIRLTAAINYADLSNKYIDQLTETLTACRFQVNGKSTYKDEFVTAGGVELSEVDFKTMQSKKAPGLYLAGEILDIDAITGGFNFQAAWTTGWIAGNSIGDA